MSRSSSSTPARPTRRVAIARQFPVQVVTHQARGVLVRARAEPRLPRGAGRVPGVRERARVPDLRDWLERLLAPFADEEVVLSYGRQRGAPHSKFSERQVFAQWFPRAPSCASATRSATTPTAPCAAGAWQALPYDEALTGLEDLDWAKRALARAACSPTSPTPRWSTSTTRARRRSTAATGARRSRTSGSCPSRSSGSTNACWLFARNVVADAWHAWHDGEALWRLARDRAVPADAVRRDLSRAAPARAR